MFVWRMGGVMRGYRKVIHTGENLVNFCGAIMVSDINPSFSEATVIRKVIFRKPFENSPYT